MLVNTDFWPVLGDLPRQKHSPIFSETCFRFSIYLCQISIQTISNIDWRRSIVVSLPLCLRMLMNDLSASDFNFHHFHSNSSNTCLKMNLKKRDMHSKSRIYSWAKNFQVYLTVYNLNSKSQDRETHSVRRMKSIHHQGLGTLWKSQIWTVFITHHLKSLISIFLFHNFTSVMSMIKF